MNHRADGRARLGDAQRPWWRTVALYHREVLLTAVVVIGYSSLGVQLVTRGRALLGVASFVLACATLLALGGWLRPAHWARTWAKVALFALVVGFLIGLWTLA